MNEHNLIVCLGDLFNIYDTDDSRKEERKINGAMKTDESLFLFLFFTPVNRRLSMNRRDV